jgi:voltage-gated potassium channel
LSSVLTGVIIIGSLMYVVEGDEGGFTSIPASVYWAIVTLTTVGFGDITPVTPLGRFLASMIMIMGWGTLAVPTGIVTVEMAQQKRSGLSARACADCGRDGHDFDAVHCKFCGGKL